MNNIIKKLKAKIDKSHVISFVKDFMSLDYGYNTGLIHISICVRIVHLLKVVVINNQLNNPSHSFFLIVMFVKTTLLVCKDEVECSTGPAHVVVRRLMMVKHSHSGVYMYSFYAVDYFYSLSFFFVGTLKLLTCIDKFYLSIFPAGHKAFENPNTCYCIKVAAFMCNNVTHEY